MPDALFALQEQQIQVREEKIKESQGKDSQTTNRMAKPRYSVLYGVFVCLCV